MRASPSAYGPTPTATSWRSGGRRRWTASSVPLSASGIEPRPLDAGGYAERDTALGGANDIVLVPNYSAADEREGRADAGYQLAEILPYAAYLDREGGIVDTMFDGFLFCPKPARAWRAATSTTTRAWPKSAIRTKRPCRGPRRRRAGRGRRTARSRHSGIARYKAKYYLTLAYPGEGVSFGDLDGDGQTDRLETLDDRIAAMRWAVDLILELRQRAIV